MRECTRRVARRYVRTRHGFEHFEHTFATCIYTHRFAPGLYTDCGRMHLTVCVCTCGWIVNHTHGESTSALHKMHFTCATATETTNMVEGGTVKNEEPLAFHGARMNILMCGLYDQHDTTHKTSHPKHTLNASALASVCFVRVRMVCVS